MNLLVLIAMMASELNHKDESTIVSLSRSQGDPIRLSQYNPGKLPFGCLTETCQQWGHKL